MAKVLKERDALLALKSYSDELAQQHFKGNNAIGFDTRRNMRLILQSRTKVENYVFGIN